ncbi:glycosyltransferase family 2 protein [Botrimarina hoheduenensis]|nr:glycosyltransferase family A protein [Botrimarina hoheduenensis]
MNTNCLDPRDTTPSVETIGVVIPVYNRRSVLLDTLPHVVAQTRLPDRVVVVDDGSTDGSAEAAEEWLTALSPPFAWQVLRHPHKTAAAARVAGYAALGSPDYTTFLDSDDHWPADFLERTLAALRAHPDAVVACVDRRYTDLQGIIHGGDDCRTLVANPLPWFFRKGAGVASCTLIRSVAYEAVGGWKPELETAEDSELFSMLALAGRWVHAAGEPVDFYLGNADLLGEENNLSRRYVDCQYRWAKAYELIFAKICEKRPELAGDWALRSLLARRWCNAGKDMQKLGRERAARAFYAQSLKIHPVQLRGWKRLAGTNVSRSAA